MFNNKTIDTLVLARKYFKLSKYNLEFISEAFNFPNKNAHRALSDVETTYKVLLKLIENGYTNVIDFGGIKDWNGEVVK